VTGMLSGELPAPVATICTEPAWVPGARPAVLTDTIRSSGVAPLPLTDSHGVAGETVGATASAAPELVRCRVWDGGWPDGPVENVSALGVVVRSGAALTIRLTGRSSGLFAAAGDVISTAPPYWPAGRPAGFTTS